MKRSDLLTIDCDEIKRIGLDGLQLFTSFCERNKLQYFLAFGTLLGAVRHSGFIPWDDDIDVLMPRRDYEKLIGMQKEITTDHWKLFSYRYEPGFLFSYMKYCNLDTVIMPSRFNTGLLYGVSIDIFPLDYLYGENREEIKIRLLTLKKEIITKEKKAYKANIKGNSTKDYIKRAIKKTLYEINKGKRIPGLLEYYRAYDHQLEISSMDEKAQYAVLVVNRYNDVWERGDFIGPNGQTSILTFENHPFIVPYNYDHILRSSYGDYMIPPPEKKQKPVHTYEAYRYKRY